MIGNFAGLGVQGIRTAKIQNCFVKILLMITIHSRWLIIKWIKPWPFDDSRLSFIDRLMIWDHHSLIIWWFQIIIHCSFDYSRLSFIVRLIILDYHSLIVWWFQIIIHWSFDYSRLSFIDHLMTSWAKAQIARWIFQVLKREYPDRYM